MKKLIVLFLLLSTAIITAQDYTGTLKTGKLRLDIPDATSDTLTQVVVRDSVTKLTKVMSRKDFLKGVSGGTGATPNLSAVTSVGATTTDVVTVEGVKIPLFAFVNSVSSLYSQIPDDSFTFGTGVFDNLNNLYLVNYSNNIVTKTTPYGVTTTFATVGTNPKSIVIDSGQNIFTLNQGSVNVSKITPTGVVTVFATVSGYNMTLDSSDNLYVTFSNGVYKVTPNGVVSLFYSGTISNTQLSIDNLDNIYVKSNTGIVQILPNGSSNLFYSSTYSSLTFQVSKTTGYVYIKDNTTSYKKLNTATTLTQITNFPIRINFIDHQTDILYYGEFESNSTANVISFDPNTGITTNYLFNQNEGIFNRMAFNNGDFYAINNNTIYKVSFTSTKLLTSDNQGLLVKSNDLLLKNGVLNLPNSSIATIFNAKDVITKEYADANYSGGGSTSITSGAVTTALGYTPYNATNPSGFITASSLTPYLTSSTASSTYQPIGSYLAPNGSAAGLTSFPILNQNTTGTAATITGVISEGQVTNLVTDLSLKVDKVAGKSLVNDTDITKIATAVQPNVNTVFTSVNSNAIVALAYTGTNFTWTGTESNLMSITLTKDSVLANPTAPVTGAIYQFLVNQNASGLWALTYGTMFKFPDGVVPAINVNANSKGILTAIFDGTALLVVSVQNFL